jgi:hypothetical protein
MLSIRFFSQIVGAVLVAAALVPASSIAQQADGTVSMSQTDIMNARLIVLEGDRKLVEIGPQRWFLDRLSSPYTEVKRTETELFLQSTSGSWPLVIDFAAKKTYMNFEKTINWAAPVSAYPTSGYSVSRINMYWDSTPVSLDLDGTDNVGWKLTTYKSDGLTEMDSGVLAASEVARNTQQITVTKDGSVLSVNLAANSCTIAGANCRIASVQPVSGLEVGHVKYGTLNSNNQWVELRGITQVSAKAWREETANGPIDWTEDRRSARSITLWNPKTSAGLIIPMGAGGVITDTPGNATKFRVAHIQRQWPGQLGTVFQPVSAGVSPGFQIQNKTDYPVLVTLEQVGCLYYGIVKPGEVFQRDTGAVWFTIKASMAPDLKEPTVESCIRKPAIYAATIVAAGFTVAGTAGMGTALVVPAMLATAAGQGAAITTQQYVLSTGGTATGALGARVGVTTLTDGVKVLGLALAAGGTPLSAAGAIVTSTVLNAVGGGALVGIQEVRTRLATQSDIDSIQGQLTQEARVFGAYAGYPWPWKMADRVMPRYDITGGPRVRTIADGTTILLKQESPLTITKVN